MTNMTTIMKLNHLSFPSHDVEATAAFFEKHLGCTVTPFGESRLMKRPGFDIVIENPGSAVSWPQTFHLGFEVPTVADVRDLYQRFKDDDVFMETAVISHVRGSRFFCRVPGGLMVEINTRSDAAPPFGGTFDN